MIPVVHRGTHQPDGLASHDRTPFADASLSGPVPKPFPLPPDRSLSIAQPLLRPSTAPPSQPPPLLRNKTQTALLSDLRARNVLFQKAISHLDDAILHLLAARCGIPGSSLEKVRGGANNRAELLDRVDRAIQRAREGGWVEEEECFDELEGVMSEGKIGAGEQSSSRSNIVSGPQPTGIPPNRHPLNVAQAQSLPPDAHRLRRAASQPQIAQQQVPQRMCTLAELVQRRKTLQESLVSWQHAAVQLRAAHPYVQSQPVEPSLISKYQQIQLEIRRREEYMAHLNQAITQAYYQDHVAALASYTPPPLDPPRFEAAYAQFCQGKSIEVSRNIDMPDVRRPVIDLYQLHVGQ